jgi:hypothetical protein
MFCRQITGREAIPLHHYPSFYREAIQQESLKDSFIISSCIAYSGESCLHRFLYCIGCMPRQ